MKKIFILFVICSFLLSSCGYEYEQPQNENQEVEENITQEEEAEQKQDEFQDENLTEDEYKALCAEIYYDEVFFGDTDLENTYVKLHLFLSEKYYFTNDNMLSDTWKNYDDKYDLNRDFYKCCVLREGTTSYVGMQINMWFSNKNELSPDDYKTGQKIIVYAKVISWSNNTMNGYNSITIIPKYVEFEQ
jgi:hypothetical protein